MSEASQRVDRIVDEIVSARGACALRAVVERHIASESAVSTAERLRIAARARRRARVLALDPEGALALEDFALTLERE